MPEKSAAFWIAVGITLFALFASIMVLVAIMRLRRIERKIALEAREKKIAAAEFQPRLRIPPKPTLD